MNTKNKRGTISVLLVISLVLIGLGFVGISFYGYAVSIRNQALAWETDLNKVYRSYENEMTTYINTVLEQTGLADTATEKTTEYVRAYLEGRGGNSPNEGNLLFKAVAEAVPNTEVFKIYEKILPTISAGREGLRNKQNQVIDMAQGFNNWRKQGIFRAWVLSGIFPSRDLQVKVGDRMFYGAEALDHLSEPIINAATDEAFRTHRAEPLKLGPAKKQ